REGPTKNGVLLIEGRGDAKGSRPANPDHLRSNRADHARRVDAIPARGGDALWQPASEPSQGGKIDCKGNLETEGFEPNIDSGKRPPIQRHCDQGRCDQCSKAKRSSGIEGLTREDL